jgi:uncharacterized protein (DUF305 family)
MKRITRRTLSALAVAAALVVTGCGDDDMTSSSASGAGGNGVDRAFVADMVAHHESAIDMAKIAQERGESEFVKQLVHDIATSQSQEITTMRREDQALKMAGVKRSSLGVPDHMKGMDADPATLKTADPFDAAFIKMMIPHHEGAIEMANVELAKGSDAELKAVAQDIIDAQERELAAMRKHLGDSGKPDKDAGHSG